MSRWTLRFGAPADWLSANVRYKRRPDEQIRAWRHATAVHAAAQGLPRGLARVSVFATLHFTDRRRRDAHNFMLSVKSCIDGLVDYGLMPDDRREHLLWTAVSEGAPVLKKAYGAPGEIELVIVADSNPDPRPDCRGEFHGADGGACQVCGWDSHPIPPLTAPPSTQSQDPGHEVAREVPRDGTGDLRASVDHPYSDPGDGRAECELCGKWVFKVIHSCKGVPVTAAAWDRWVERQPRFDANPAATLPDPFGATSPERRPCRPGCACAGGLGYHDRAGA